MKIFEFKSVSPLFEMLWDGEMPFTTRKVDYHDPRWRALSLWQPGWNWGIRFTNPATGVSFVRKLKSVDYVRWVNWEIVRGPGRTFMDGLMVFQDWKILVLGEIVPPEEGG